MKKFFYIFIFFFSLIIIVNISFAQDEPLKSDKANVLDIEQQQEVWPVRFNDKVIFYIKVGEGKYTPEKRAQSITNKIAKISKEINFDIDKIKIIKKKDSALIVANNDHMIIVTSNDAEIEGKTTDELSKEIFNKIKIAFIDYKNTFSIEHLGFGVLYTILTTVLFLFVVSLLSFLISLIYNKVKKLEDEKIIKDIEFLKYSLISSQKVEALIKLFLIIVQITVTLAVLYLYIVFILEFFPWNTSNLAYMKSDIHSIINITVSKVVLYLPNIFIILIISVFSYFVIKISKFMFTEIKSETIKVKWFQKEWSNTTHTIIAFLTVCFALALIYPHLPGADSNAFKGISIFVGILVSIGSSSSVSNIIAGVIITYTNAFNLGERVQILDNTGDIVERNMFAVKIRTIKNELISIPNSKILNSEIINFSNLAKTSGLIIHTNISIGYDEPWQNVYQTLIDAALNTENVLKDKTPFVLQKSLDDFYVNYELNAYIDTPYRMANIYSELHQNIQDKFNEAGIEILSPHYSAIREGNKTSIPQNYLDENYVAPTFNVKINKD